MACGIEMIRGRIMIEVVTGCHNQLGKADLSNARILIKVVILAIQRENSLKKNRLPELASRHLQVLYPTCKMGLSGSQPAARRVQPR